MQNSADGRRPLDQAHELEPLTRLKAAIKLHPPSPSLLLSSKADIRFTIPQRGRRLSPPRWLVIYPDGLSARKQSAIHVVTGPSRLATLIEAHALTTTLRHQKVDLVDY